MMPGRDTARPEGVGLPGAACKGRPVSRTAAAIAAAAGILLLAGVLAHVSPDIQDDWSFAALPVFLGDAFAHILGITPTPTAQIGDTGSLLLDDPTGVFIYEDHGKVYAVVTSNDEHGIQILDITNPGAAPTSVGMISDNSTLELEGAWGIAVFNMSGRTYAAVASTTDDGVQVLDITDPSSITATDQIDDGDGSLELNGARGIAVFERSGRTYAAVAAHIDDGVQILNLTNPSNVTAADKFTDSTYLNGAIDIATFESGGRTYAAVPALYERSLQVLDITDPGDITDAGRIPDTVVDGLSTELANPAGIAIFEAPGRTYGAVAAYGDNGFQLLNLTDVSDVSSGVIQNTAKGMGLVRNSASLVLESPYQVAVFEELGRTYAAVTALGDRNGDNVGDPGIQIIDITNRSSLEPAGQLADTGSLYLDGPRGIGLFTSGGVTHAVVTGGPGNGVQVIKMVPQTNDPPTISMPSGFTAVADNPIPLNAAVTDPNGDPFTVAWTHNSTLSLVLANDTAASTTVAYPTITEDITVAFTLTATDNHGAPSSGEVVIVIPAPNQRPVVDAGPQEMTVDEGTLVNLRGTASDPDMDHPLTHRWTYTAYNPGDPPIVFADTTVLSTNFTAPLVDANTEYVIILFVTDRRGAIGSDRIYLNVTHVPSPPPVNVTAGPDRTVTEGETVTLTGSADEKDGDPMTANWSCEPFPSSPAIPINLGNPATTTLGNSIETRVEFTAPQIPDYTTPFIADGTIAYTCTFTATDIHNSAASDTMTLIVQAAQDERPVITLMGPQNTNIAPGESWSDPGATCATKTSNTPLTVTTSGDTVDIGSNGTYKTTYSCEHNGQTDSITRTVKVFTSNEPPTIGITTVRTQIGPGDAATDFGSDAICRDQEEGSLVVTSTVSIRGQSATITYTCTDSGGRTATATQEVAVLSSSPPKIHLEGSSPHYLTVGDVWADPGAYCMDAEDGRIPAPAVSAGPDTDVAGHYTVSYMCTDSDGNIDTIARNVFVNPPGQDLPPVLTIPADTTIAVNGTWSIPSATCTDNEDGDLSDLVWTWSEEDVDVTKAGTYHITYFCTDSADNETQATMTVTVKEGS